MRKLIALAAVSAAAFSATAAQAQDESPFAGFYIGGQVSYGQASAKFDDYNWYNTGARAAEAKADNVLAGAKLGYNVVKGNVLAGIEAEAQIGELSTLHGTEDYDSYYYNTLQTKATLLGSVRAKLGLTKNNLAVFVSGGYAFSDAKHDYVYNSYYYDGEVIGQTKADRSGYVLGMGASYAVSKNTAVSLEASRYQFSNSPVSMYEEEYDETWAQGFVRNRYETLTVSYTVKF